MIWKLLKHFNKDENWGNPAKMNFLTLLTIDRIRDLFERRQYFIVHCGFDTQGHTENSYHYKAKAIDFHIMNIDYMKAIRDLELALKNLGISDLIGLGLYPQWEHPGFHIDTRGFYARWGRVNGKYISYDKTIQYIKGE